MIDSKTREANFRQELEALLDKHGAEFNNSGPVEIYIPQVREGEPSEITKEFAIFEL